MKHITCNEFPVSYKQYPCTILDLPIQSILQIFVLTCKHKHANTQTHKHTKSQSHKHTNTQTHKVTNTKSQTQKPRNAFLPDPELKKCAQEAGSVSHICISSFNYYRNRKNFYTIQNNTSYYRVWWPIYRCMNIP